ncbi:TPA: hypothetical protein ACH3X3_005482 [Trebouxia sp. C0006]
MLCNMTLHTPYKAVLHSADCCVTGCQVCPDSDFVGSCNDCDVDGCWLTCESCRDSDGNFAAPAPFTIPAGGCVIQNSNTQLRCMPYTVGECPIGNTTVILPEQQTESKQFASWKIGLAVVGGLAGLLLIAILTFLLLKRRRQKQLLALKRESTSTLIGSSGTSDSRESRFFNPMVPQESLRTRLSSAFQSLLVAVHLATPHANVHYVLDSDSGSKSGLKSGLELGAVAERKAQTRIVHASIINKDEIYICKIANGEDWLLGMGSYGMVYKAKMGQLDVAVKTIHRQHVNPQLTSHQALRIMQKELQILESLPFDKHVVEFHGSYTQDDNIYMVLEFMQGGDLKQALRGPLSATLSWYNKGAQIALDVIKGVHFLHCHGILHKDIKSGNVLLSEDFGSAKICDVGLAHIMGDTSLSSSSHYVQTTFTYAAPELLMNERCDERADIFSFGVVVWELITQKHARRGQLREFKVPEECPQAVSDMVCACLDQQAAKRPTAQHIFQVIQTSIQDTSCRSIV